MPAVARLGDKCSGHGCWPPRKNTSASSDVFVNGIGAHRVDDTWAAHTCKKNTHTSILSTGSSTVFVNNKALGRIGDDVACGSAIAQGSSDVFSG